MSGIPQDDATVLHILYFKNPVEKCEYINVRWSVYTYSKYQEQTSIPQENIFLLVWERRPKSGLQHDVILSSRSGQALAYFGLYYRYNTPFNNTHTSTQILSFFFFFLGFFVFFFLFFLLSFFLSFLYFYTPCV